MSLVLREAIPEGNDLIPQDAYVMVRGIKILEDFLRIMSEAMDKAFDKHFGQKPENLEDLRTNDQRVASLKQDVWQPRLAMEADGLADTKTRERTEGAAAAVQAMHGDSFSANRVQTGQKTTPTSLSVKAEPPTPLAEMTLWSRTALRRPSRVSHLWRCAHPTAASGLLPSGMATTATRTTFHQLPLWFC